MTDTIYEEALAVLKQLIATESFSKQENDAADLIAGFLQSKGIPTDRHLNNIWAIHPDYRTGRTTILLDSHIDTVKPSSAWTYDPFTPVEKNGKLFGLGSNDAGAPLMALMATFLYFMKSKEIPFNLIFAATAEEEISGYQGIEAIVDKLGPVDLAIIGEPTKMELAIAEKGLMVLDCISSGKAGHAARDEGENAIYNALSDIEWFRNFSFEKESAVLGPVKMSVTLINAGSQHNVVPDVCTFVVDVRTNEYYRNQDALDIILKNVKCEVKARSLRLNSSSIPSDHPLLEVAKEMNIYCYGSPTTSDQAVIPYTSVKMGPGDSARSHTADEFIYIDELRKGIAIYIEMLQKLGKLL